jgi:hypothetical protein
MNFSAPIQPMTTTRPYRHRMLAIPSILDTFTISLALGAFLNMIIVNFLP